MENKKSGFGKGFIFGMISMLIVGVGIHTGIRMFENYGKKGLVAKSQNHLIDENTQNKINYLDGVIHSYYLEDADDEKMKEGMYKGILASLGDPYSVYYTSEEFKDLMDDTTGVYSGIGTVVSQNAQTGILTALQVIEGSPAEKAGMKNGDLFSKVDDKNIVGEDINKVVSKLKGEKGTKVKVTVYRPEQKKYIDLNIIRDEVKVPTVNYKMLDEDKKIGYVRISEFDDVTYNQFKEAVGALKEKGMKAVIFDVRDNPGGVYDTVCSVLDYLLPEGTLVFTRDKYGNEKKKTSKADCLNIPMVVLQNENSASASEIFAGAIQDFGAGKIVGTKSFGKGIVQVISPLDDGSAIKLTVENYYTPSGKNIHGKGIEPDVEVKSKEGKEDNQLDKAQQILEKMMK